MFKVLVKALLVMLGAIILIGLLVVVFTHLTRQKKDARDYWSPQGVPYYQEEN